MATFDKEKVSAVHSEILRRKFDNLYDWEKPVVVDGIGPNLPNAFDTFSNELNSLLCDCHEILLHSTDEEIAGLSGRKIRVSNESRSDFRRGRSAT